jgi:hypothetical protein
LSLAPRGFLLPSLPVGSRYDHRALIENLFTDAPGYSC